MTLTFGSLFAGIGGFDLGLERAGLECRWQVENDPYCIRVLEKHWPDVPRYGDVFGVSGGSLEAVDAICGGFPCQPVSLAGRRQGTRDPRWLWPEYARLVAEIRPKYVIVENVPGLRSKGGCEVVADLAALGYSYEWDSLSAEAVRAPHKRERFILVAYPHPDGFSREGVHEKRRQSVLFPAGSRWRRSNSRRIRKSEGHEMAGIEQTDQWTLEPSVGRVVDGVSYRVDRLRSLGNAIVPQVAEMVGRWIVKKEKHDAT